MLTAPEFEQVESAVPANAVAAAVTAMDRSSIAAHPTTLVVNLKIALPL